MQSFYTAKIGMKAQQFRLDEIASNIANENSVAYKCENTGFKDTLYTQIESSKKTADRGTGTLLSSTHLDFSTGTPVGTGENTDLCINGDGFFAVEDSNGNTLYTRNGHLRLSNESDGNYLVNSSGDHVLNNNGNKIMMPAGSDISVSREGVITVGGTDVAALKLVTFTNKNGLSLTGEGCYATTSSSGGEIASDASIEQGYLESSNVDISTELTQMMLTQRAFSLSSKAMSTWNDMESVTNNLRT